MGGGSSLPPYTNLTNELLVICYTHKYSVNLLKKI